MFFEQRAQGITIEHVDLYALDAVDLALAPAAGDDLGARVAQHFGRRQADARCAAEHDCFLTTY